MSRFSQNLKFEICDLHIDASSYGTRRTRRGTNGRARGRGTAWTFLERGRAVHLVFLCRSPGLARGRCSRHDPPSGNVISDLRPQFATCPVPSAREFSRTSSAPTLHAPPAQALSTTYTDKLTHHAPRTPCHFHHSTFSRRLLSTAAPRRIPSVRSRAQVSQGESCSCAPISTCH